jgi:hypothetical protein
MPVVCSAGVVSAKPTGKWWHWMRDIVASNGCIKCNAIYNNHVYRMAIFKGKYL